MKTVETSSYKVKSGDTLAKIARNHGTTIKAIKAANGLKTDHLKVGQSLKIPAGKMAAKAESAPTSAPATSPAGTRGAGQM